MTSKLASTAASYLRYNCVISGSGSAAFGEECVADVVIRQALKVRKLRNRENNDKPIQVSYVGTTTYDSLAARQKQTGQLEKKGCKIVDINVTWPKLTRPLEELRTDIMSSDVLLISGGNTLYAIRRWKEIGLDKVFREAAENGVILSGGSAGAIAWFDGGHSDSADPTTFRPATPDPTVNVEAQSEKGADKNKLEDWKYIRVTSLGFFPGLLCPHHDRTQSNGVPRYIDFDAMMKRHAAERGICIDHWCVLIVEEGGKYELFEVPEMGGSVVLEGGREEYNSYRNPQSSSSSFIPNATFDTKNLSSIPGMWIKDVSEKGEIVQKCCAPVGKLEDILRFCPADRIELETAEEEELMKRNPIS